MNSNGHFSLIKSAFCTFYIYFCFQIFLFFVRHLFLSLSMLFGILKCFCQTSLPEVISSGGGFYNTTQFSNSFTIGEMCLIETYQLGPYFLTQGFQQPDEKITSPSTPDFFIPNGITPNGDGVNDSWSIPDLLNYPKCTIKIFNRWGQLLYSNNGYTQQWDGTYKEKALPSADYYYVISLEDGDGKMYSGTISIKR